MIGWIIGIVVVLLIVCWVIGTYNGLIKGRIVVDEAFATMDVYLKKRYDLIPNLVETVKGYASHEKETLEKVISLRTGSYDAMTPEEKIQNGAQISKMIPQIMAVAEQYPDLKANQNFMDLSHNLNETEDDIANASNNLNKNSQSSGFRITLGDYWSGQVYVFNDSDAGKTASECYISEVYLPMHIGETQNVMSFAFPVDMTLDELLANESDPTDNRTYEGESHTTDTVEYKKDSTKYYGQYGYKFEFLDGNLQYITIDYLP